MLSLDCGTFILKGGILATPQSTFTTSNQSLLKNNLQPPYKLLVKIVDGGLYFIFPFHLFYFSFNFLFLEQLGLGVISHAVTSVTT